MDSPPAEGDRPVSAALTGATGFLGGVLLGRLLADGQTVRVLVRREADARRLEALRAACVVGDLTDPGGCRGLVGRGDVVYHAAARVDMVGSWDDFHRTTVQGTRHLLDAALEQGPARFVYVSSAGVYPTEAPRGGFCADRTAADPPRCNLYGRAKLAAEQLVRRECERAGCPWTIVRLGFLYGPGNEALYHRLRPLLERGQLRVIGAGDNRIAACYIDDAAEAVRLAGMHPSAAGRVYDVANDESVTQRQFLDAMADVLELPRPTGRVPRWLATGGAVASELLARLPGVKPALTRAMVALMAADKVLDSGAIRRELDWRPEVDFAQGVRRTHEARHTAAGA